jgi:hypothetical protein
MEMEKDFKLRFPIGEQPIPDIYRYSEIKKNIHDIIDLPSQVIQVLKSAGREKLQGRYRENGWTGLQVLHHIADSHVNGYCRLKLALTETNPTIKPYEEQEWALLRDYDESMIEPTLALLQAIHTKWTYLMDSLSEEQWNRTFYHPANQKKTALFQHAAIYAWHGRHHLEHIKIAIKQ